MLLKEIKLATKRTLASLGLINPVLGVKITTQAKAEIILQHCRPMMDVLVETGTEFGTIIDLIGKNFKKIYSIEFDQTLYEKAREHFASWNNVALLRGDSGDKIEEVLRELHKPALFWLDAHGPGHMTVKNSLHCPIEKELTAIYKTGVKEHVIVIDDARHFDHYSISVIKKLAQSGGHTLSTQDGLFILKSE